MQIFISYSRKDGEAVTQLATDLKELGHDAWFDHELRQTGGQKWWSNVLKEIREREIFVFALTPTSLVSEACEREYQNAHTLNKPIIPIMLDTVDLSSLPDPLRRIQVVDFRKRNRRQALNLGASLSHIERLLSSQSANNYSLYFSEMNQASLTHKYEEEVRCSTYVDIISLTLQVTLENFGEPNLLRWIEQGRHFRLLMLSPDSVAAKIRGIEEFNDENYVSAKIEQSIKRWKDFEKTHLSKTYSGSLEVRQYDGIPYFGYFCADETMIISLNFTHLKNLQSRPLFIDINNSMCSVFKEHFNTLWEERQTDTVIKIGHYKGQVDG